MKKIEELKKITRTENWNLLLKDLEYPTNNLNVVTGDSILVESISSYEKNESPVEKVIRTENEAIPLLSVDDITRKPYDVVLGNPPYANIPKKDTIYKRSLQTYYKAISSGIINSSSLFLKRGIDLLREGGMLGFIVPKSITWVDSYSGIRKYILNTCEIVNIADVGKAFSDVGYEQIILILRKQKDPLKRSKNHVEIATNIKDLDTKQYQIHKTEQSIFESTGMLSLYLNDLLSPIVAKMNENSEKLGNFSDIFRGLPIQKIESEVVTEGKRSIYDKKIIRGKHINSYIIETWQYLDGNNQKLRPYQNLIERMSVQKIVLQRLVTSKVRIVATFDGDACCNFDTITNVIIRDAHFLDKYILALLNSNLMAFYIRDIIFNRSTLTMDMDKPYLGALPIKKISIDEEKGFEILVDEMLNCKEKINRFSYSIETSMEYNELTKRINSLNKEFNRKVYALYNIQDQEIKIIEKLLS